MKFTTNLAYVKSIKGMRQLQRQSLMNTIFYVVNKFSKIEIFYLFLVFNLTAKFYFCLLGAAKTYVKKESFSDRTPAHSQSSLVESTVSGSASRDKVFVQTFTCQPYLLTRVDKSARAILKARVLMSPYLWHMTSNGSSHKPLPPARGQT